MFVIRPRGNLTADVIGDISNELNAELEAEFIWTDPLDFTNVVSIYQDRRVRVGAMQGLCQHLNDLGHPTRIELPELEPAPFNWEYLGTLRPLQDRLPSAGYKHRFGLLCGVPGVGKTQCLSNIVATLGRPAVILTQAKEPFFGAYETLRDYTNCNVGLLGAGISEPNDVTVCLVQTGANRLTVDGSDNDFSNVLRNAQVWITDEAHNCLCERYSRIFEEARNVNHFLGTTATPFAPDDKETLLYARLGPILAEITHAEAIDHGVSVPFTLYYQDCPGMQQYKDKDPRMFQYGSVYSKYITYNKERCNQYLNFVQNCLDNDLTCAIIVSKIKHGKTFKKLMPELTEVYGSTSDKARKQAWADLQSRKIKCVVTTLMDEATNIPSLDAVAIAAGGKSKTRLIQRLRNLRTFDGETEDGWYTKERGYVYITIDDAPYVGTHSKINLKNLKALANAHPLNEVIKV